MAYDQAAPGPALHASRNHSQTDPTRAAATFATMVRLSAETGAEAADMELDGPRLRLKAALSVVPRNGGSAPEVDTMAIYRGHAPRDADDRTGQRFLRYETRIWEKMDADGRDAAEREFELTWCKEVLQDEALARTVEQRHRKSVALQATQLADRRLEPTATTPQMHMREVLVTRDMAASFEKMHTAQTMRPQHVAPVAPVPLRGESQALVHAMGDAENLARLEEELRAQTKEHVMKHAQNFDKRTVDPVKNRGWKNRKGKDQTGDGTIKKALLSTALRRFVQNVLYGTGNVTPLYDPLPPPPPSMLSSTGDAWDIDIHEPVLTATQVVIPVAVFPQGRPASDGALQSVEPLPPPSTTQGRVARSLHVEEDPDLARRTLPRGLKPKRKQHTTAGPGGASSRLSERGSMGVEWADPNDDPSKLGLDAFTALVDRIMAHDDGGDPMQVDHDPLRVSLRQTALQVQCALEKRASKGILPSDGDIQQIYSESSGVSAWANVHEPHPYAPDGIAPIIQTLGPVAKEGIAVNDARVLLNSLASDTINKITVASLTRAWEEADRRDTLESALGADTDPAVQAEITRALTEGGLRDTRGGLTHEAGQFFATRPALRDTDEQRTHVLQRAEELANQPQLPALIELMKRLNAGACERGELCYDNHLEKAREVLPDSIHPESDFVDRQRYVHANGFLAGYLLQELEVMHSRPCKNAFTGECVGITISRRTRGRVDDTQLARYAPELIMLRDALPEPRDAQDAVFRLVQHTTDQVYFGEATAEWQSMGEQPYVMREFLFPKQLERMQEWVHQTTQDPEYATTHPNPLSFLPQTCLLCANATVDKTSATYNSGQIRAQDPLHCPPGRPDLFLPLGRGEWRTGPGQYNPAAMRPNAFYSKDQDNSHLPGRPTIVGKVLAHIMHHYQLRTLFNTELVGSPGLLINRPVIMETNALDFQPVLSNINASFAGLPKWGWGTISPLTLPTLPAVSAHYERNRIRILPLKPYEAVSPFELFENEQQAWYYHLGRTGRWEEDESPISKDWVRMYGERLCDAQETRIPSWSTFILASPIALQDGAWFARVRKAERFSRLDSWTLDHYRVLEYGAPKGSARVVVDENLENLPLVLLRRFLLMRGRLARLLFFEDSGLALGAGKDTGADPQKRGESVIEQIESSYLHQLYNPSSWDVQRLSVPQEFLDGPETQEQLAEELVRWEAILAPTISTLRYFEGKVSAMRAGLGPAGREHLAWVYDPRVDRWRRGQRWSGGFEEAGMCGMFTPEWVALEDLFYRLQIPLPLALFEAAKERIELERIMSTGSDHRPDALDLVNLASEGFSLLAVALFKVYNLHRLQALAVEYRDSCLLAMTRLMIEEWVPFFTTCTAHNVWSDEAWYDPKGVKLPTRVQFDPLESSIAPHARLYAHGFRTPKDIPWALSHCALAQIMWPGVRASRVSIHDAPDITILTEHIGTVLNMPGEYTSTQDFLRIVAALAALIRKCDPLKSQKREERSIAHRIMAKFPAVMNWVQENLHIMQKASMPFIFQFPPFMTLLSLWAGHKGMRVKFRRTYPNDSVLETTTRIRTWLINHMLYEPMPDKHLKKRAGGGAGKKTGTAKTASLEFSDAILKGAYFRYHNRWFMQWLVGFAHRQTSMGPLLRSHPHQGVMNKTQQTIVRTALAAHASRIQYVPIVFPTKDPLKYEAQVLQQAVVMHAHHAMQTRLHGAMNKQLRIVVQKAPFWELLLEIFNKFYNSLISKVIQFLRPLLVRMVQKMHVESTGDADVGAKRRPMRTANGKGAKPAPRSKGGQNTHAKEKVATHTTLQEDAPTPREPTTPAATGEWQPAPDYSLPTHATTDAGGDQDDDGDALYGAAPRVHDLDQILNELNAIASGSLGGDMRDWPSFSTATAFDNVWDQQNDEPLLTQMFQAAGLPNDDVMGGMDLATGTTETKPTHSSDHSSGRAKTPIAAEVTLFDTHRPALLSQPDGPSEERSTFDPTHSPPTALHCYSLVQIQRVLRMFIARLLRVPALDDAGREEVHLAFKRIVHKISLSHSFQQELPKTFLGYFGVSERVLQLVASMYNQYIHGSPHNGIETTVHKMWFDYRDQLATVWRYVRYRAAFAQYRRILLPRHIAQNQKRAIIARHAHLHPIQVPIFAKSVQEQQAENVATNETHVPVVGPVIVPPVLPESYPMDVEPLQELDEADIFAGLQMYPQGGSADEHGGMKTDEGL